MINKYKNMKKKEKIIELETEFIGRGEVSGFRFKQIKRSKTAYIYSVDYYYEVFLRRVSRYPPHYNKEGLFVRYPGSSSFGYIAWTFREYEKALDKFNSLSNISLKEAE